MIKTYIITSKYQANTISKELWSNSKFDETSANVRMGIYLITF
jgi:hypothetical protein